MSSRNSSNNGSQRVPTFVTINSKALLYSQYIESIVYKRATKPGKSNVFIVTLFYGDHSSTTDTWEREEITVDAAGCNVRQEIERVNRILCGLGTDADFAGDVARDAPSLHRVAAREVAREVAQEVVAEDKARDLAAQAQNSAWVMEQMNASMKLLSDMKSRGTLFHVYDGADADVVPMGKDASDTIKWARDNLIPLETLPNCGKVCGRKPLANDGLIDGLKTEWPTVLADMDKLMEFSRAFDAGVSYNEPTSEFVRLLAHLFARESHELPWCARRSIIAHKNELRGTFGLKVRSDFGTGSVVERPSEACVQTTHNNPKKGLQAFGEEVCNAVDWFLQTHVPYTPNFNDIRFLTQFQVSAMHPKLPADVCMMLVCRVKGDNSQFQTMGPVERKQLIEKFASYLVDNCLASKTVPVPMCVEFVINRYYHVSWLGEECDCDGCFKCTARSGDEPPFSVRRFGSEDSEDESEVAEDNDVEDDFESDEVFARRLRMQMSKKGISDAELKAVVDGGDLKRLVFICRFPVFSQTLLDAVLAIGNIAAISDEQTVACVKAGAVKAIVCVLDEASNEDCEYVNSTGDGVDEEISIEIRDAAVWSLANIAGTKEFKKTVTDEPEFWQSFMDFFDFALQAHEEKTMNEALVQRIVDTCVFCLANVASDFTTDETDLPPNEAGSGASDNSDESYRADCNNNGAGPQGGRKGDVHGYEFIDAILDNLVDVLDNQHVFGDYVTGDVCTVLMNMTTSPKDLILSRVVKHEELLCHLIGLASFAPPVTPLMGGISRAILSRCLKTLGNIASSASSRDVDVILRLGVLDVLVKHFPVDAIFSSSSSVEESEKSSGKMSNLSWKIVNDVLWTTSNIVSGTFDHLEQVADSDLLDMTLSLLQSLVAHHYHCSGAGATKNIKLLAKEAAHIMLSAITTARNNKSLGGDEILYYLIDDCEVITTLCQAVQFAPEQVLDSLIILVQYDEECAARIEKCLGKRGRGAFRSVLYEYKNDVVFSTSSRATRLIGLLNAVQARTAAQWLVPTAAPTASATTAPSTPAEVVVTAVGAEGVVVGAATVQISNSQAYNKLLEASRAEFAKEFKDLKAPLAKL